MATVTNGRQAIDDMDKEIGRNTLITHLINNNVILNPLTAAWANPLDGSSLRWIKRIY